MIRSELTLVIYCFNQTTKTKKDTMNQCLKLHHMYLNFRAKNNGIADLANI